MRVFITGAAGFIGTATTRELIANGHQVLGLARSDANVEALKKIGAEVHRGSLEDLESLKSGAKQTDGTIHCAFIHDFAKFAENGQIDKRAIEAMGDVLEGTNKPFIVTSGTALIAPGAAGHRRHAARRQRACSARVGTGRSGLCKARRTRDGDTPAAGARRTRQGRVDFVSGGSSRTKRTAAYVGDGSMRWAGGTQAGCRPSLPAGAGEGRRGRNLPCGRRRRRAHAPDHRGCGPCAERACGLDQARRSR